MSQAQPKTNHAGVSLKDPALFRQQGFINGEWVSSDSKKTIEVNNPATGEIIGSVPNMAAGETKRAIEAAEASWKGWRELTAKERAHILRKWCDLIRANIDDLSKLLTTEQGKPLAQAKSEILSGADYVEWMADEGRRIYGDVIPSQNKNYRIMVLKQPIGVSAMVTPWNFPSSMITRKAGAALAAGCPVVLKPSEMTPFSALALAELSVRAGFPKGLFNIVTGDPEPIGREFCANPVVRKLGFTGSTAVGKKLMAQCADTVKKVSLELGGNAPFIIFDDADIDAAVSGTIISKFRNSGQTCICANRIFVQDKVYDAFVAKFTEAVKKMKVGHGQDEGVELGPLINMKGLEKVEAHLEDAKAKGAKIVIGGKRHTLGGTFFEPTVVTEAKTDMRFFKEETFGPLAPIFRFKTEEEAVKMANDTEYGLAAYFYSRDLGRVWRVSEALEYGMVGVNSFLLATEQAPFGGVKESGIGREGSKYGIEEYLEIKYLSVGGI